MHRQTCLLMCQQPPAHLEGSAISRRQRDYNCLIADNQNGATRSFRLVLVNLCRANLVVPLRAQQNRETARSFTQKEISFDGTSRLDLKIETCPQIGSLTLKTERLREFDKMTGTDFVGCCVISDCANGEVGRLRIRRETQPERKSGVKYLPHNLRNLRRDVRFVVGSKLASGCPNWKFGK